MDIRTYDDLAHVLERDLRWRRSEIAVVNSRLRATASGFERNALLRAGVALLYAHWEGFIKHAARAYLELVASRTKRGRLGYAALAAPFVGLALHRRLRASQVQATPALLAEASRVLLKPSGERASVPTEGVVTARSNLRFGVLEELLTNIGIDPTPYKTKEVLINESLVDRRNNIAHGEYCPLEPEDFDELRREVLDMLTDLSNRIQNAALGEEYLATGAPPAVP